MNLCAHNETRTSLVKILMDMLLLDTRKPVNYLNDAEPSYRLYACQTNVMYSRPQYFDGKIYLKFLYVVLVLVVHSPFIIVKCRERVSDSEFNVSFYDIHLVI